MDWLTQAKDWIVHLGKKHHVNPLIFGAFYLVGKTTFLIFIGVTVRNLREDKPFLVTLLISMIGYCLAMLYVAIAGRDIPFWIYTLIGAVVLFGMFVVWRKVQTTRVRD